MIPLGRRLYVLVAGAVLVILLVAVSLGGLRRLVEGELRANHAAAAGGHLWTQCLNRGAATLRAAVAAAFSDGTGATLRIDELAGHGLKSLTVYDEIGQPGFVWPAPGAPPPLDSRRINQLIAAGEPFQLISIADGTASLVVGGLLPRTTAGRAGFVATARIDPLLNDLARSAGGSAFIFDDRGRALAAAGTLDWASLAEAMGGRPGNVFTLSSGDQVIELVVMPLSETAASGHLGLARDVTLESHLLDVVDSLSAGAMAVTGLLVLLSLHWLTRRLTGPLGSAFNAMAALAEGDTGVEVLGDGRRDEIGQMARSVRVFRDHMRASLSTEQRRLRQWQRQQDFIRAQMLKLAGTLPEDGRASLFDDLRRIGGMDSVGGRSLGVALELMTAKVLEQHARLDELVAELTTALAQKAELFELKEKLAIARRIQANMLPRGLGPEARFEAAAVLEPAEQFDGGFYDYVPLGQGRLGVVLGQPAGGELAAGFVAATARSSLKVLLSAGLAPADSLARTAELLSGDDAAQGLAMAVAVLDADQRQVQWASAGIDPPLLIRRLGDAIAAPFATGGVTRPGRVAEIAAGGLAMPPQATLIIVSPALTEEDAGHAGHRRLLDLLRNVTDASPSPLLAELRAEGLLTSRLRSRRDRFCVALRARN